MKNVSSWLVSRVCLSRCLLVYLFMPYSSQFNNNLNQTLPCAVEELIGF